mmetsp:Transcript_52750/g.160334  ORF Transcript_52750/g.160334 Transcript_52750/m.160334 type:complete len:237 (-) Transcript_52750:603-1313(-)
MRWTSTPPPPKPDFSIPVMTSAMSSLPSWLTSRASNVSRSFLMSLSFISRATISKAAFLSLLWTLKLRRPSMTALSNLASLARGASSLIQTESSACSAVARTLGLILSIVLTNAFASSLTCSHEEPSNFHRPFRILSNMMSSGLPLNGGRPLSRMYMITPVLHMSHWVSYLRISTCGAMYMAVPTRDFKNWPGATCFASPKSISFSTLPSCSMGSLRNTRKFSGLRSRCAKLPVCI